MKGLGQCDLTEGSKEGWERIVKGGWGEVKKRNDKDVPITHLSHIASYLTQ